MSALNEVRLAFKCCLYHANPHKGIPVHLSKARVVLHTAVSGLSSALNLGMPLQHIIFCRVHAVQKRPRISLIVYLLHRDGKRVV